MVLQLVTLYTYWGTISFTSAGGSIRVGMVIEIAKLAASVWLIVVAIRVLGSGIGFAKSFWIVLFCLLATEIVSNGVSQLFIWNRVGAPDRLRGVFSAILSLAVTGAPAGILLTIVRSSEIRKAIEGLR